MTNNRTTSLFPDPFWCSQFHYCDRQTPILAAIDRRRCIVSQSGTVNSAHRRCGWKYSGLAKAAAEGCTYAVRISRVWAAELNTETGGPPAMGTSSFTVWGRRLAFRGDRKGGQSPLLLVSAPYHYPRILFLFFSGSAQVCSENQSSHSPSAEVLLPD